MEVSIYNVKEVLNEVEDNLKKLLSESTVMCSIFSREEHIKSALRFVQRANIELIQAR